ncbi:DUF4982 domain-containing protein [Microbacterium fluvii]|uniref:DUF4982 domain-containing protein n=1 Tax=Microbacterium fluvii TaxID=415215 RepID=A0ABW2HDL8_9MICO|nr:DUF4982 domain-containing protein [Microbacterium fluvii]MCU4673045.1 DUF4982 domain-containing protein [Microbacterium fluvii]
MTGEEFAYGWAVMRDGIEKTVDIPHDAMIDRPRRKDAPAGAHNGWFPGGRAVYRRSFRMPADADERSLALRFEGVQGEAAVRVDGRLLAQWHSGYREVIVPLDGTGAPGAEVSIEVDVDHTGHPDSRWYTGTGIYRDVTVLDRPRAHIVADGIRTSFAGDGTLGHLSVDVETSAAVVAGDEIVARLVDAQGRDETIVASASAEPRDGTLTLEVDRPRLWSAERPDRYRLEVAVRRDGIELHTVSALIGLRTVTADARRGLRVNGDTVLLRGACIHHDNGLLGAATLRSAEFRRARLLKEAGYNAVRSAHNPLSRHFLDACDELGLYVVDELTDVWFLPKTTHDGADRFASAWRSDARSMVRKNRLHPSVIMHSIGNENPETATAEGVRIAAEIVDFLHAEDPRGLVTTGINFMLNAVSKPERGAGAPSLPDTTVDNSDPSLLTSTMINVIANRLGPITQAVSRLPAAERRTKDVAAVLDVVGYNYAWGRYRRDARHHPARVILGTESFAGDLARIWPRVEAIPAVIGDFVWTGWDYLGEVGIGSWTYEPGRRGTAFGKSFPHVIAGPGAIDIVGTPGAPVAYQRAVWGLSDAPEIMVRPLDVSNRPASRTAWRSTDAIASWSWPGHEGERAEVEVYSDCDDVELLLDGRSLGRKRAGRRAGYRARFRVVYAPGELTAIGYRGGREVSRAVLRSAGSARLALRLDTRDGSGADAWFVWVEVADDDGIVDTTADVSVELAVEGATLAGFGSANPAPAAETSFADRVSRTYRGRALAVLRPRADCPPVTIAAHSDAHGDAVLVIDPSADAATARTSTKGAR